MVILSNLQLKQTAWDIIVRTNGLSEIHANSTKVTPLVTGASADAAKVELMWVAYGSLVHIIIHDLHVLYSQICNTYIVKSSFKCTFLSVIFITFVTSTLPSCLGFRKEPQTAHPMSFTSAFHIATSASWDVRLLPNQSPISLSKATDFSVQFSVM